MLRVGPRHALAASALHCSSDLISSVLVLLDLAAPGASYPHADSLAAIGVAGSIAVAGYRLVRATIDALVDRAPDGRTDAMRLAAQTPGVAGTEAIRLRTSGARIVRELIVSAPRTLPLERVAAIKAEVATRSGKQWPQADLTISANPIPLDDETILERVLLNGTRLRLPVHHVVIQDMDGRKSVALDLEVDSAMNLESRPFDRFRPRGGHRRRGPKTALGTLGWDREFHGPLAVARPTAGIDLEPTLPSRGRRYTRGPDRDRWPYDLRFSDTSHQDAKSYASAYACAVPLMIHPTPYGLVRDRAFSLDEKIINLSEAQRGPATKPDRPSHDFGRTPLSVVADFLLCLG
jgi:hypothetical protein